ncbi:MAG: 4,5-dioxygenase [Burkholderiales bacterium]|nr:4,5-dioxygenase [Burkholderiales bacterium]
MLPAIHSFHAHIYYDPASNRATAAAVREAIAARFLVRLGRWHDLPVGPHPRAMFQVAFRPDVFAAFVPWLMLNRAGLTVLVHPNTGRPRDDHLVRALWMGELLALEAATLPETESTDVMETEPNTAPRPDG